MCPTNYSRSMIILEDVVAINARIMHLDNDNEFAYCVALPPSGPERQIYDQQRTNCENEKSVLLERLEIEIGGSFYWQGNNKSKVRRVDEARDWGLRIRYHERRSQGWDRRLLSWESIGIGRCWRNAFPIRKWNASDILKSSAGLQISFCSYGEKLQRTYTLPHQ